MSISDVLMWKYFDAAELPRRGRHRALKAETEGGRNPRDAKVLLAKEITTRFHGPPRREAAEADFNLRARGGIPDEIESVSLEGAPLGIGAVLKQARLAPSTSEAMRLIDGGGVRLDGAVVTDRGLKLAPAPSCCRSASASSRASRSPEAGADAGTDAASSVRRDGRRRDRDEDAGLVAHRLGRPVVGRDGVVRQPRLGALLAGDGDDRRTAGRRRPSLRPQQGRVLRERLRRPADRRRGDRHRLGRGAALHEPAAAAWAGRGPGAHRRQLCAEWRAGLEDDGGLATSIARSPSRPTPVIFTPTSGPRPASSSASCWSG